MIGERPYRYLIRYFFIPGNRTISFGSSLRGMMGLILLASIVSTASAKIIKQHNNLASAQPLPPLVVPEMKWVLLPAGNNGSCVSNTDCCANTFCYGLEYTPGNTGELTSYTTAFFAACVNDESPVVSNLSCVMSNNSTEANGCEEFDLIQFHCSGNTGTLDVTTGVPVIIHQVCFSLPPGTLINLIEDEVTDLTASIDLSGGGFVTEYPEYESSTASHAYLVTSSGDNGPGTFRDLVNCAAAGSTILFDNGMLDQIITLTSGAISINKNLTVIGPGMLDLTLSGNNSSVIFHVLPGNNLTLKEISLQNASAPVNGGAIFAEGNVIFQNVLLQNNLENGIPKSMTISTASSIEIIETVTIKN